MPFSLFLALLIKETSSKVNVLGKQDLCGLKSIQSNERFCHNLGTRHGSWKNFLQIHIEAVP